MAVFEVWDPKGVLPSTTFTEEKKANEHRDRMEKTYKRDFRLRKHFGEIKLELKDEIEIFLEETGFVPGDIITLEKGILVPYHSNIIYRVKKMRVREDGTIVAVKKEIVNGIQ